MGSLNIAFLPARYTATDKTPPDISDKATSAEHQLDSALPSVETPSLAPQVQTINIRYCLKARHWKMMKSAVAPSAVLLPGQSD